MFFLFVYLYICIHLFVCYIFHHHFYHWYLNFFLYSYVVFIHISVDVSFSASLFIILATSIDCCYYYCWLVMCWWCFKEVCCCVFVCSLDKNDDFILDFERIENFFVLSFTFNFLQGLRFSFVIVVVFRYLSEKYSYPNNDCFFLLVVNINFRKKRNEFTIIWYLDELDVCGVIFDVWWCYLFPIQHLFQQNKTKKNWPFSI